ncbi:hypothetical protein [Viridibacillus arvi]|uniref:hypothetical protein n=1 Tax=Viridibacillus arvi TaxID=263475 RepID=UPI003D2763DB
MLTDLLWLAATKQQYENQKSTGLAGAVGLVLTLLICWQWDHVFQPIIHFLKLDAFAYRLGIVSDTTIHTVINSAYLFLIVWVLLLACILLPSLLAVLFTFVLGIKSKIILVPLSYLILFALSPFIFIYLVFKRVNERFRISSNGSETLRQHYLRDSTIRNEYKEVQHLSNQLQLHHLHLKQADKSDQHTSTSLITYNEAVTYLNRAVASIATDTNWLFGYNEAEDQWYILFTNPLPVFASTCFEDNQKSYTNSAFHYKEARENYTSYLFNLKENTLFGAEMPAFHVPALPVIYSWNGKSIQLDFAENKHPKMINVRELKSIEKIKGLVMQELSNRTVNRSDVQAIIKRAHVRAYLIPIAYPEEITYLTYTNGIMSYVNELNAVPFTQIFGTIYQADVVDEVRQYARWNNSWAIDYANESAIKY